MQDCNYIYLFILKQPFVFRPTEVCMYVCMHVHLEVLAACTSAKPPDGRSVGRYCERD